MKYIKKHNDGCRNGQLGEKIKEMLSRQQVTYFKRLEPRMKYVNDVYGGFLSLERHSFVV
jgi:hypothetical protein